VLDRWDQVIEQFKAGEIIDGDDFLKLCELYEVKIPIRTKGWARQNLTGIDRDGTVKRCGNASGSIKDVARELYKVIAD
jgi:hypothetical protein